METKELFCVIQNSRDWQTDDKGKDLQYKIMLNHEERRVYILVEETKTRKDWFYNFLFLPFPFRLKKGTWLIVHSGWLYLSKTLFECVKKTILYTPELNRAFFGGYEVLFSGWSAGVPLVELLAARFCKAKLVEKPLLVGFASPAYCYGKKTAATIKGLFSEYLNYLWYNDWIKYVVPLCKRNVRGDVFEKDAPCKTLDERHRIYGKGELLPGEI